VAVRVSSCQPVIIVLLAVLVPLGFQLDSEHQYRA
jgi:fumarate reductase subunit D